MKNGTRYIAPMNIRFTMRNTTVAVSKRTLLKSLRFSTGVSTLLSYTTKTANRTTNRTRATADVVVKPCDGRDSTT